MGSTKFSLSWSDHEKSLVGSFKTLFKNKLLVDCTIAADGKQVKAHRVILSASSSYFESIFGEESEKHPIVFLKGVKFELVLALLDFIYSGKVEVTEDQLEEFLNTAQSLHIKGLTDEIKFAGSESKTNVRKYLPCLTETIEKKNEDDSSKMMDCDALSTFQVACDLLAEPLADEENLNNNTSPSLDHQYCAENAEAAQTPFFIVSGLSANPETSSSTCEPVNAFDSNKVEKIGVPESPVTSSNPAEEKSLINLSPVLLKSNFSEVGNGFREKKSKCSTIDRSALKAILGTPQPNKICQKPGTKPTGSHSAGAVPKQKIISSSPRRQAFIVGNKVLAVPRGTILTGCKEWLQPAKPHLDGKLYPCPECNKAFRKPSILANHRRTHTGEKPYQCQECGRMFNQSSNFRRHQRIHIEQRLQKAIQ